VNGGSYEILTLAQGLPRSHGLSLGKPPGGLPDLVDDAENACQPLACGAPRPGILRTLRGFQGAPALVRAR
jgi:hypothetical protein